MDTHPALRKVNQFTASKAVRQRFCNIKTLERRYDEMASPTCRAHRPGDQQKADAIASVMMYIQESGTLDLACERRSAGVGKASLKRCTLAHLWAVSRCFLRSFLGNLPLTHA